MRPRLHQSGRDGRGWRHVRSVPRESAPGIDRAVAVHERGTSRLEPGEERLARQASVLGRDAIREVVAAGPEGRGIQTKLLRINERLQRRAVEIRKVADMVAHAPSGGRGGQGPLLGPESVEHRRGGRQSRPRGRRPGQEVGGHQRFVQRPRPWTRTRTTVEASGLRARGISGTLERRSGSPENQAGSTGTDQRNLWIDQLIRRCATELPHGFGGQVQSMDVALADQATVRVAGKAALRS